MKHLRRGNSIGNGFGEYDYSKVFYQPETFYQPTGYGINSNPSPFSNPTFSNHFTGQATNTFNNTVITNSIDESILETIYDSILVIPENTNLFGRLMFLVNNNQILARSAEVKEIIRNLANNSNAAVLNSISQMINSDAKLQQLATSITSGYTRLASAPIDWSAYSTPIAGTSFTNAQPGHISVANRINDAISKLKELVENHGFTNMDNAKKLKKFWDANFVPKYKEYSDISFGDIWTALQ